MSTNHVSMNLPEATPWLTHHLKSSKQENPFILSHPHNNTEAFSFNLNRDEEEEVYEREKDQEDDGCGGGGGYAEMNRMIPKEHLFEKPLTPSDVGKLNRLVIPKQHAEKYFPLSSSSSSSAAAATNDSGEKGLLLNFEDESGKSWRFRYSYWNSSQSYVLTKGWSRFVKDKQLDAGDVVTFERHRFDGYRFFIGWRRKNAPVAASNPVQIGFVARPVVVSGGGGGWSPVFFSGHPDPSMSRGPHHHLLPYQPDCLHAGSSNNNHNHNNKQNNQTGSSSGNLKRLRLFGVNMEWVQPPEGSEPCTPDGSSVSSQGAAPSYSYYPHHYYHHHHHHNNQSEINLSTRDVNQMRYQQR